uniref:Uncharacterized protein n=1 Tax=Lactuca sativa TaxID=4236 RepID=A0A9R1XW75_LACSA|nr:hypothetical protein LSAT_V11C100012840 [Lactuca sativa]
MTWRLTNVHTPYARIVLHKRMQKCVRWQATKIPPEIPFFRSHPTFIEFFILKKTCVVDVNRYCVLDCLLDTSCAPSSPSIRIGNTRPFDDSFIANLIAVNYCVMENIIIALIFVTYCKDRKKLNLQVP